MIKKCLDINNCHLTKETFHSLDYDREPYTYRYPEGVVIAVPDRSVLNQEQCPKDLRKLLSYAWEQGTTLIHMDRDADVDEELPTYTWGKRRCDSRWNPVYLSKEEVRAYWESRSICIEFPDGSDALAQENGYTLERCLQMENVRFFLD